MDGFEKIEVLYCWIFIKGLDKFLEVLEFSSTKFFIRFPEITENLSMNNFYTFKTNQRSCLQQEGTSVCKQQWSQHFKSYESEWDEETESTVKIQNDSIEWNHDYQWSHSKKVHNRKDELLMNCEYNIYGSVR